MLKPMMRRAAKEMGYEVLGPPRAYAAGTTMRGLLVREEINLILDVGANAGQFGGEVRGAGYGGKVVSFEPQAAAYAQLCAAAAADANWTVAPRTALGAEAGEIVMHTSANSYSSSLLPMLAAHSDAAPESGYVGEETVRVQRLDDVYRLEPSDRTLLKIDVQGYEKPVLDGASQVLARCRAVMVEMSLVPLYEGQILALPMWEYLSQAGFEAWSFEPGFRNAATGQMLQMDGLFVRRREALEA